MNYKLILGYFFFSLFFVSFMKPIRAQNNKNDNLKLVGQNQFGNAGRKFVENTGQLADSTGKILQDVLFYGGSPGIKFYIKESGISYFFTKDLDTTQNNIININHKKKHKLKKKNMAYHRIDMQLIGASKPLIIKEEPDTEVLNFFLGHTPDGLTNIKSYKKIIYKDIYPKIDMIIYWSGENLKYDFIIAPGGDPSKIKMKFDGQDDLKIDNQGNLIAKTSLGTLTEEAPLTYQIIGTKRLIKNSLFIQNGNIITFNISEYNKSDTLIIDPTRIWGTYFGGSNADHLNDLTNDIYNNIYIVGQTFSNYGIATTGSYKSTAQFYSEAFIAKFNSTGKIIWATYYGGNGGEDARGVAIGKDQNIYLTGITSSSNGIATTGTHQTTLGGGSSVNSDAFIAKFNSNGGFIWGTYYGGSEYEEAGNLCLDDNNNVYITGRTESQSGIATTNAYQTQLTYSSIVPFIAKFNNNGIIIWGTYFNISIDGGDIYTDNTYLYQAGNTENGGLPVASVAKFNLDGTFIWKQNYGGSNGLAKSITTDLNNNIYVVGGTTSSSGISTTNTLAGSSDGFILKLNSSGTIIWGKYLGGSGIDEIKKILFDKNKSNIILIGHTQSYDFPILNAYQNKLSGVSDLFMAEIDLNGSILSSTYYGGIGSEIIASHYSFISLGLAIDKNSNIYLSGTTNSYENDCDYISNSLATFGAHQTYFGGNEDGFMAKFDMKKCGNYSFNSPYPKIKSAKVSTSGCPFNSVKVKFDNNIITSSVSINDFEIEGRANNNITGLSWASVTNGFSNECTLTLSAGFNNDEVANLKLTGNIIDNCGNKNKLDGIPLEIEYASDISIITDLQITCGERQFNLCVSGTASTGPFTWTKDGIVLTGSSYTGNCIYVTEPGNYSVTVNIGGGCVKIAEPVTMH